MFHSAVLCCLLVILLSIVQATASTCCQQDCHQNLMAVSCNILRRTGERVPLSCQPQPRSCLDHHLINQSAPSGSYQIELDNGTMVNVYCDMEGTNCNGEGGWTRVAFVNMSEPGATCPTGLLQIQQNGLTLCSRDDINLIQSAFFATLRLSYSAVCGRLSGYQLGDPSAFLSSNTIDQVYADGVSITHGSSPRKHVWTYAAGFEEDGTGPSNCPCNNGSNQATPPFVRDNNYYCESGSPTLPSTGVLYPNDRLWDGMLCRNAEKECCTNNRMPWFDTTLPDTTTDDIELRVLINGPGTKLGSPLELIELYIR